MTIQTPRPATQQSQAPATQKPDYVPPHAMFVPLKHVERMKLGSNKSNNNSNCNCLLMRR